MARVVFYKTGQTKAEEEETPNTRLQLDPRDSRGSEEGGTKARIAVTKWRKRKKMDSDTRKGGVGEGVGYRGGEILTALRLSWACTAGQ